MQYSFVDRNILITGASAGFGAEFARQFHRLGAKLFLIARRERRLKDLCDSFNGERPDSAQYLRVDLSKYDDDFKALIERIHSDCSFDVLINNAGFGSLGHFEELSLERELDMIAVNVSATVRLAHAVIPGMKKKGSGYIVSLSSIAGFQPLPYMSTYAATKAFNYQHSLGLREELKEYGIKVLTVCPGPVGTEFGEVSGFKRSMPGLPSDTTEGVVRETITAMRANKRLIVPCPYAKLLALGSWLVPKGISTRLAGKQNKAMIS